MPYLTCYGQSFEGLADLVGDFDLLSEGSVQRWKANEWRLIAEMLGFSQPLKMLGAPAGVDAFGAMMKRRAPSVSDSQARVQGSVLQQVTTLGRERGELWQVRVDPSHLPGGACYVASDQKLRAFEADISPGYFGDGWPGPPPRTESACGWQTPLVLYLGTFPWVYSARLSGEGPGLRWTSGGTFPAIEGMRVMASFFDPEFNLRQDARQVAAIYAHFRAQTQPLLANVPLFRPGAAAVGRLYRHEGFLHVSQGSLHLTGLDGPRGRIAASAYNYCLRRFACFFAVRRATLRDLSSFPSLIKVALASHDPCLVEQARQHTATPRSAMGAYQRPLAPRQGPLVPRSEATSLPDASQGEEVTYSDEMSALEAIVAEYGPGASIGRFGPVTAVLGRTIGEPCRGPFDTCTDDDVLNWMIAAKAALEGAKKMRELVVGTFGDNQSEWLKTEHFGELAYNRARELLAGDLGYLDGSKVETLASVQKWAKVATELYTRALEEANNKKAETKFGDSLTNPSDVPPVYDPPGLTDFLPPIGLYLKIAAGTVIGVTTLAILSAILRRRS